MVDIDISGSGVVHLEMVIDSCTPYNLRNQHDNYLFIGVAPRKACLKAKHLTITRTITITLTITLTLNVTITITHDPDPTTSSSGWPPARQST